MQQLTSFYGEPGVTQAERGISWSESHPGKPIFHAVSGDENH
jgi:hypothetical protein